MHLPKFGLVVKLVSPMVLCLGVASFSIPVLAAFKPSNDLGRPGNREGAGTRVPLECVADSQYHLTALVPYSNIGLTTAAFPTFVGYIPANTAQALEFKLYEADQKLMDQTLVYQASFKPNGRSGFVSLDLPEQVSLPPLAVGKDYHWYLTLVCNPDEPSENAVVEGWVRRVQPDSNFSKKLAQLSPRKRFLKYAESGLWYDALSTLLRLRQNNPKDAKLAHDWAELLQSQPVQLGAIAEQPVKSP